MGAGKRLAEQLEKKQQSKTTISFGNLGEEIEIEPLNDIPVESLKGMDVSATVEYLKQTPDIPLTLGADGSIFVDGELVLVDKRLYEALFKYLIKMENKRIGNE